MSAVLECITWFPVEESLPDDDTTVLLARLDGAWSEPTCKGYLDGGIWYEQTGTSLDSVPGEPSCNPEFLPPTHWAHVPAGPICMDQTILQLADCVEWAMCNLTPRFTAAEGIKRPGKPNTHWLRWLAEVLALIPGFLPLDKNLETHIEREESKFLKRFDDLHHD